jgi:hypothetical protein
VPKPILENSAFVTLWLKMSTQQHQSKTESDFSTVEKIKPSTASFRQTMVIHICVNLASKQW